MYVWAPAGHHIYCLHRDKAKISLHSNKWCISYLLVLKHGLQHMDILTARFCLLVEAREVHFGLMLVYVNKVGAEPGNIPTFLKPALLASLFIGKQVYSK